MGSGNVEIVVLSDSDGDQEQDTGGDQLLDRKWWSMASFATTSMGSTRPTEIEIGLPVRDAHGPPPQGTVSPGQCTSHQVPLFAMPTGNLKGYKIPKRKSQDELSSNEGLFKLPKLEFTSSLHHVSAPSVDMVKKILELCRQVASDRGDIEIVNKMEKRMSRCGQAYTTSSAFVEFAVGIYENIVRNPTNRHVRLKELYDEMTALKSKVDGIAVKGEKPMAFTPTSCGDEVVDTVVAGDGHYDGVATKKVDVRIRRLEKRYKCCQKKIDKLESRELSLDDLNDDQSDYILLHRYKQRVLEIWAKLCELTGRRKKTGRLLEKKFSYTGSRFEVINTAVTELMKRCKFPDFADISDVVGCCNDNHSLHLRPSAVHQTAKDIFEDIGKELKRRRIADYEEHYGCPSLDERYEEKDPANTNPELQKQFAVHREMADLKMDEIFLSYQRKQLEQEQEPANVNEEDEDEDEDEGTDADEKSSGNDVDDDDEDENEDEDEDDGNREDQPNRVDHVAERQTSTSTFSSASTAVANNMKSANDSLDRSSVSSANQHFWDPRATASKPVKPPPRIGHVMPTVKPVVRVPPDSPVETKTIQVKRFPIRTMPFLGGGGGNRSDNATSDEVEVIVLE